MCIEMKTEESGNDERFQKGTKKQKKNAETCKSINYTSIFHLLAEWQGTIGAR